MYKSNGALFIGNFDHGKAQGKGVFIFDNGSYYKGDFYRNKAESEEGTFESEQLTYTGGFRDNKFDGKGIERGKNDSYVFQGTYINGARERGILEWSGEGGQYKYEGPFNAQNQFHGHGTLFLYSGQLTEPTGRYEGGFQYGEKEGENCTYISENGTRYEGSYAGGYRDGYGTIFNGDGSMAYKGGMKRGLPHGTGSIMKNGKEMKANWVEGIDRAMLPQDYQE